MELFVDLMAQNGITLLYTSHHLEHAVGYADRLVGLRGGVVELDAIAAGQNVNALREIYE